MFLRQHLPNVYLDEFFSSIALDRFFTLYRHSSELPHTCDMIARTFWHNDVDQILTDIDHMLSCTNQVMVYFAENTTDGIFQLLEHELVKRCCVFYEMVQHCDQNLDSVVINWFDAGHNPYIEHSWGQKILQNLQHGGIKQRMFDCLLGSERPHRDWVARHIVGTDLESAAFFSYFRHDRSQCIYTDRPEDVPADWRMDAIIPISIYNDSHYSLVTETWPSRYKQLSLFTEKTAKPLMARRPFVYFAAPHQLKNLRRLGFRTFDPVVDESYDNIQDDDARWTAALQSVQRLLQQDPHSVLHDLQAVLDHNHEHFMHTDWWRPIRRRLDMLPLRVSCSARQHK